MNNTFSKYRPPYFWTRYRSFLLFQNIGLHTSGQDITFLIEVHDKGDPFSKLYLKSFSSDCTIERGPQIGAPFKVPSIRFQCISAQMLLGFQTFHYIVPSYYSPAIYWFHHIVPQGDYCISAQTPLGLQTVH